MVYVAVVVVVVVIVAVVVVVSVFDVFVFVVVSVFVVFVFVLVVVAILTSNLLKVWMNVLLLLLSFCDFPLAAFAFVEIIVNFSDDAGSIFFFQPISSVFERCQ